MLHYDTEFRQQLASEHAQSLAQEMRRIAPDDACSPGWAGRGAKLVRRTRRLLKGEEQAVPAYDA
jgi:hypothetical protein